MIQGGPEFSERARLFPPEKPSSRPDVTRLRDVVSGGLFTLRLRPNRSDNAICPLSNLAILNFPRESTASTGPYLTDLPRTDLQSFAENLCQGSLTFLENRTEKGRRMAKILGKAIAEVDSGNAAYVTEQTSRSEEGGGVKPY